MSSVRRPRAATRNTPKYRLCPVCEGEGRIVNPACSVWTGADIAEDPEGFEAMLEGVYDVTCPCCDGQRVVTADDLAAWNECKADHRTRQYESGIYPGHRDWTPY